MKSRTNPIHVWVPGIREGSGGIQAFSRNYVQALREAYPHMTLQVFVKNDVPSEDDPLRMLGVQFHSVTRWHPMLRTLALVVVGLFFGIRDRPCCTVATHLNFLPALCVLRYLTGIPCVAVLHGIEAWNIRSRVRFLALRAADHLISVSEFTREFVISHFGVARERVSVVPNTFDSERFKPGAKPDYLMQRYGFKVGQPVLMTVSRLALSERYKGHRQVLVALPEIRKHFPDVRYLIVGTGDDAVGIQNAVYARNLEGCVVMAGHIPSHELADHYRLCDAFVMPSSKEGFGIVFLEAMASGKPVVAGCIDGSVDAVGRGRLSPMVDPNDVAKIGDAIVKILQRDPPDALWFQPEALSAAVKAEFGFAQVSRLMAQDLATVVKGEHLQSALEKPPVATEIDLPPAPKILIVVRAINPARVRFFNALSAHSGFNLEVIYLTNEAEAPLSLTGEMAYNRVIFSNGTSIQQDLRQAMRSADLVIFGSQATPFARQALRERMRMNLACVLWLGMPDLQPHGFIDTWRKRLKLDPLHRYAVPFWTTSTLCQESLQREFGGSRAYRHVPLPALVDSTMDKQAAHSSPGTTLDKCVQLFRAAVDDAIANGRARAPANAARA